MEIIGAAACTIGVAHTYIAQEKPGNAAEKVGYDVQIETQRTIGIENELTRQQIDDADTVILAVDVKIAGTERFRGRKILKVPAKVVAESLNKLIEKAVEVAKK